MQLSDFGVTRAAETLPNGIRLVVFERPSAPVSIELSFLRGARFDGPNEHGLAHLAEHLLTAGTKKFPTKDLLALFIERLGGYFGASTGIQTINFSSGVGDPTDWRQALLVLQEMVEHSLLDEAAFETERGSVMQELGAHRSQPGGLLSDAWLTTVFAGTPIGRTVLGTNESLQQLTVEDVRRYVHNLHQSRCVMMVSGGISLAHIKPVVMEMFPSLNSPAIQLDRLAQPAGLHQAKTVVPYDGKDQIRLAFGYKTCGTWHKDQPALNLLSQILGGGRAASLTKLLRYQKGLVYSIGAGQSGFMDDGEWSVGTVCSKENVQGVLDIVVAELNRAKSGGITQEELQFVQERAIKSKRGQLQTSGSWIDQHFSAEMYVPNLNWTVVNYIEEISAVTRADIQRVAQTYFLPGSWYLVMCGNIEEDEVDIQF